jgi:hypothetical protein
MATDQKLVAQLLDLSRNVEKLSGEIKKNTSVSKDLVKADSAETKAPAESKDAIKIAEGLKSFDIKGLMDEFKGLKEGLKGIDKLDFKGLENGLKSLDFKGLEKGIKGLDFKGITEGLKGFDVKGITESFKGIGDLGGVTKNLASGSGVKDLISGSVGNIGKGLLGGFENGGKVQKSGPYLVGEGGPEIAQLPKDANIIPNEKTEAILSGKTSAVNKRNKRKDYPSKEEIEARRSELLKEDPVYYSDPSELNADLEDYIANYKNGGVPETFTMEDVAKLGKPDNKSATNDSPFAIKRDSNNLSKEAINPNNEKKTSEIIEKKPDLLPDTKKSPEKVEKKPGLFSRIFSKENVKNVGGKIEGAAAGLLGGGLKEKLGGTIKGSAESLINKESLGSLDSAKGALSSNLPSLSQENKQDQSNTEFGQSSLKKNMPALSNLPAIKSKSETIEKPKPIKEAEPTKTSEPINNMDSKVSPEKANDSVSDKAMDKGSAEGGITKKDIDGILGALNRMASLLEGPLTVSPLGSPSRPDSRRI